MGIRRACAQIRSRAAALLKKHPLGRCSGEVQAAAAEAERSRRQRSGRKRFGGRYTRGFWADCNGRAMATPRVNRFDGGADKREPSLLSRCCLHRTCTLPCASLCDRRGCTLLNSYRTLAEFSLARAALPCGQRLGSGVQASELRA